MMRGISGREELRDDVLNGGPGQDILDGAQGLGVDLDEHIAFCVKAMQDRAEPLGLKGTASASRPPATSRT